MSPKRKVHWGKVWGACSAGRKLDTKTTTDALEVTCDRCIRIARVEIVAQLKARQSALKA